MQTILYLIKRCYVFIKVDFLVIKSISMRRTLFFICLTCATWIWKMMNNNIEIDKNIVIIQLGILWIACVYFFKFLNQQNFFHHLITNRGCFYIEAELMLFLISVDVIYFILNFIFLYFIPMKDTLFFLTLHPLFIIDALLFANLKIWKYVLFQITISVTTFLTFIITSETQETGNLLDLILQFDNFGNKKTYFITSVIEFLLITKILKNTKNTKH